MSSQLTNSKADFQTLKFPVFGLCRYRERIIVSGGAGAKNVGIQDKMVAKSHSDRVRRRCASLQGGT